MNATAAKTMGTSGGRPRSSAKNRQLVLFTCLPLLLILVIMARPALAQYKTERPVFNEFLNYGVKKVKPGPEIANEVIKSKVEVLGEILKHHVHQLRQVPDQRLELVFLVDSSASVGAENFFNEIKFVKKLLADFAVSYNQTRVAVITFSSKNKVIRHIDHVTQASAVNHKCSLLELELPRIRYSGGGTYTLGALLEAQSVIALARPDTVKAVFLVTDGYSNGGDPRPAAAFLQARGVRIFTFGIRNGNVKELYDMASVPKEEHSYILDSFEEFEALARRALHEDLHSGVLIGQDARSCLGLCEGGDYCCDTYATCTCGTHTGHYACTCRKGYFGGGLNRDCRPCPAGTYKDQPGPGDVSSCTTCPDRHMMSAQGSTSPHQCYCKRGYNQVGLQCHMLQCPALVPPENGYFVRKSCSNVMNAACGVRCHSGYTLRGSSIRLCGPDGTWSGGDAQCVMKSCNELQAPSNGTMVCSQPRPTMDTECHFTCNPGFQLVGSKMRTCLPVAMWDGIPAYCKPINCPTLPSLRHGQVTPDSCTATKSKYGTQCDFSCDPGYQLSGPIRTTCVDPGMWSGRQKIPRCIDVTPPELTCPENQTVTTEIHESYALVTWDDPDVQDNSGGQVRMITIPTTTDPMKLSLGTHTITYLAKDKRSNKATCQFSITVLDEEPPRVDWCDSPPIFLSHEEEVDVYWEEPIFSDNSGAKVMVSRSLEPGQFPQGDTMVEYMAQDPTGNTASCNITITVQKHACQLPVDPINGAANCTEDPEAIFCTLTCYNGYAFAMRPQQDYFCAYDGVWLPDDNPMPFPECSVTSVSNSISQSGEMAMEDDGSVCDDIFFMGQVENQLEKKLEEALSTMCNDDVVCEVAAVEAVCENILSEAEEDFNSVDFYGGRRRRSTEHQENSLDLENDRPDVDLFARYWPLDEIDGDDSWLYWARGASTPTTRVKRVRRGLLQEFDDFKNTKRHKRQFGFSLDHLFNGRPGTSEAPAQLPQLGDENYLGVLIDLITRSMASDIGGVRFASFLSSLEPQRSGYTTNDFMSAFSQEFGEEKADALRELASRNIRQVNFSNVSSTQSSSNFLVDDLDNATQTSSSLGEGQALKRAFKIRFKVEGHGEGVSDQVGLALDEVVRAAGAGELDLPDYGERQLRVAAIRLRERPQYICEAGSVAREDGHCVKCPVGTFFNVMLLECLVCPQGSFQPREGQVSCLVCPTNTSTKTGNAKSDQDCKAQCLPGTYSSDGLEACTTCEEGSYQDEYSSTSCAPCPHATTTWRRGSWLPEECQPMCEAGQVSETGLSPCFNCPQGYFQQLAEQKQCMRCPGGGSTPSPGSASIHNCSGVGSDDQAAAYSDLETLPMNDCFSAPCLNLATCTPMVSGYVCDCPPGYTGQHCETEIDECESEPCYHNGTCLDLLNNFHCVCNPGFEGPQCELDIDECDPDPCTNDATCVDLVDGFKCVCESGYTGEVCDIDIDECAGNPCESGSTCQDLLNDFVCECPPGDTGRFCETHINECESSPCLHGLCLDQVNNFSCVCEAGYGGYTCEEDLDDCASEPCLNGATCSDWLNGFSCTCTPGYTGKTCHQEMATNFVLEFPATGILDYSTIDGFTQSVTSVSVCFWLRSEDSENYGTPFSYATDLTDNAFTITDYNGFVVYVNGDKRITDVRGNDGSWNFFCVTWASEDGTWAIYKNGELGDYGVGLANGTTINGSGVVVLGQEQDQRGGAYSPQESFVGQLTQLNVWDEALSHDQVQALYVLCDRYVGSVRGWPDFQAGIKGQVTVKSSTFCRGCGVPSVPSDGSVREEGSGPGGRVTITCNEGFKLYRGQPQRVCLVYGDWSGEEPECQRVDCGFPGYLVNGHMEGMSYSYADTVSYTCNPGFSLQGPTERSCMADGKWSLEQPFCELVQCPYLNAGPHGEVNAPLPDYLPSNQISFQCQAGYQMDGPGVLTCGGDGEWDGDAPSCQSRSCTTMPIIPHSFIEGEAIIEPGGRAVVKCDHGYRLQGDPIITCKDDTTWALPLPKCVRPKCPKPPDVQNGRVRVRASADTKEAVYRCANGYVLQGSKILTCGEDGDWSADWSVCLGLPCPAPTVPPHTVIPHQDVWRVGDVIDYQCEMGYSFSVPDQPSAISCDNIFDEGKWNGSAPQCSLVTCAAPTRPDSGNVQVTHRPPATLYRPQLPFAEVSGEIELRRKRRDLEFPSIKQDLEFPSIGQSSPSSSDPDWAPPDYNYAEFGQSSNDLDFGQSTGQASYDYNSLGQSSQSGQSSSDSENFGQSSSDYEYTQTSGGFDDFGQSTDNDYYTSQTSGGGLEGSQLQAEEYPYNTEVEFDCRPGYKLLGVSKHKCTETGEWDHPEPRCYEQYCSDLPSLLNGHIVYHGSGVDSRAEYVCDEGYNQEGGDFELLCQADTTWLGEPPSCQLLDCGEPPDIGNGTREFTTTMFGSLASYDCFFGFVIVGSVDRYCSSYGQWNGSAPRCEAVTCRVPPVIENGYITFEGSLYVDSPIEYECKECFKLNGTYIRNCQVDGSWSLEEPVCNLIYCEELPTTIADGRVIGEDNSCGSLVEYECLPGYQLVGSQKATCLDNARWSSATPTCERVSCGPPTSLDNGGYTGTSFLFTDKITYVCDEGYVLQGSDLQVCQEDETWTGAPPFCAIMNCTKPQWPSNGRVRLSGLSFGSYASIVCDDGYTIGESDGIVMCNAAGNWNKDIPHCMPVICPPAPRGPHASYNSSELQFESFTVLKYICDEGYRVVGGEDLLTCTASGQWSPSSIQCQPVDCGDPGSLPYGQISGTTYTYESEVQFSCDEGYKLLGAPTAECLSDGSWSNYATACLQIICPEPGTVQFGSVIADDGNHTFGTSLMYDCNVGYTLQGSSIRTCNLDGFWDGAGPRCQPVTCSEPLEALNAVLEGELYEYSHDIRYTCNEGYFIQGTAELECQADGSWSDVAPICEMIRCPDLPELLHGTWKIKRVEDNPINTEPLVADHGKGRSKGRGKVNALSRLQVLLQEGTSETLQYNYGEVIEAECDNGYSSSYTSTMVCTQDGWSGTVPQCHIISCPIPVNIRRGTLIGDDHSLGATIRYECDEGHDLIGVTSRTCQENKEWTDTEPFCRLVECPQPAHLQNGRTIGERFRYRSVITYQCDSGFRLEGHGSRVCQSDGHWTGDQPVCVELFCDMPPEVPHGVRDVIDLKVGGTVRYSCLEGYRMAGWAAINCISEGNWDTDPPTCTLVDCGQPPSADHVLNQGQDTTYGSQVVFSCERGYRLEGSEWTTCLQSGQWSSEAPWCERVLCAAPSSPLHGSIASELEEDDDQENEVELIPSELQRGNKRRKKKNKKKKNKKNNRRSRVLERLVAITYPVDSVVRWECDEGFRPSGDVSAMCEEAGEWSNGPPRCSRVSCGPPELPDNARSSGDSFLYGATANYTCREGHVLMGESILVCQANGEWSGATPSCPPVSCGPPFLPPHTLARYIPAEHNLPHSYGSTATFNCHEGYQLIGGEYQVCESDGEWHGPDPVCQETLCEDSPFIFHGDALVARDARPQTATLACHIGFNLVGAAVVHCRSGHWQDHNATCEPVNCYEPTIPAFGKITAKHFTYGSIGVYSCIYGYMLVGNPEVECVADGTWRGETPICRSVDCGIPEGVSSGDVSVHSTALGGRVEYTCLPGYQLFGDQVRECTANATWSGDLPQCHRKDCGELLAPEHGYAIGFGTVYQDYVKFRCEQGYVLEGEHEVHCNEEGVWSAAKPQCQPVSCSAPPQPPNTVLSPEMSWVYQDRLTFTCREGHITRGDLSTVCLHTGHWAKVQGQCSKVSCGRPRLNSDGAVILGRSFYYGDKVVYRCPPGKVANGSSVLICLGDGSWSGEGGCLAKCGRRCRNGGVCLSNNVCSCPPGYVGDHCQHALCPRRCLNGGVCSGPHRCTCLPGYAGPRCHSPVCEEGCGEGGQCIGPNACHCLGGHVAASCPDSDYPDYDSPGEKDRTRYESWDIASFSPRRTRWRGSRRWRN